MDDLTRWPRALTGLIEAERAEAVQEVVQEATDAAAKPGADVDSIISAVREAAQTASDRTWLLSEFGTARADFMTKLDSRGRVWRVHFKNGHPVRARMVADSRAHWRWLMQQRDDPDEGGQDAIDDDMRDPE